MSAVGSGEGLLSASGWLVSCSSTGMGGIRSGAYEGLGMLMGSRISAVCPSGDTQEASMSMSRQKATITVIILVFLVVFI
jgi:hypothetical protein